MNDAVTNLEVEDVLSSIRRLIADVPAEEGDHPSVERLVLTPEQRVDTLAEPQGKPVGGTVHPLVLNNPIPPAPELVDPSQMLDEAPNAADASSNDPAEDLPEVAEGDAADAPGSAETDLVLARAAEFFGRPANTEGSVVTRRDRLEATIAELEAAVAGATGQWEPDGTEEDADDLTVAETPHRDVVAAEAPATAQVPAHAADAPGLPVDEAQLRAMISAALRDELRGPLGDRITQNVRKMVRSEIYRIITTEELE